MRLQKSVCILFLALIPFVPAQSNDRRKSDFADRIAAMEKQTGGRIGVAALDTASGKRLVYRSTERFAMCSTFKFLLTAAVLDRVDSKKESLDRSIPFGAADLLEYAPVTKTHVHEGHMTVSALSAAAIERSDNTAANLLLQAIGGPKSLTRYARSLGDAVTRIDRNEPSLNSNIPEDIRDTTSPAAMLDTMLKLLTGDALSPASRRQLQNWMIGCTTGAARLRAGFPSAWHVGDKTGRGDNGATNDIAIAWPPSRSPILVAVYFTSSTTGESERDATIAEVARIIASEFGN
jgi:beta-lactamase class A